MEALKNGWAGAVVFTGEGEKASVESGKKRRGHKAAVGESAGGGLEFQDERRLLDQTL